MFSLDGKRFLLAISICVDDDAMNYRVVIVLEDTYIDHDYFHKTESLPYIFKRFPYNGAFNSWIFYARWASLCYWVPVLIDRTKFRLDRA